MTKAQEKAIAEMPQTGFHFNEDVHLYVLDGKPLTGVTTILGVIAKPALIQWSADEAVKFFGWFDARKVQDQEAEMNKIHETLETIKAHDAEFFYALLCDARTQHAKRKDKAASTGTDAHAEIEKLVKDAIKNKGNIEINLFLAYQNSDKKIEAVVKNFLQWAIENKITFLESEKRLFSKELWFAGTCDLTFIQDGRKYVGDIKTSSGIYDRTYFFQTAGYRYALEEAGEKDFVGACIIRCGKDGSFETKYSYDYETDLKGFMAALALYKTLDL